MNSLLGLENLSVRVKASPAPGTRGPRLLVELEPWGRTFWRNLGDVVWRGQPPALTTTSPPGQFWQDVFVSRPLPWSAFAESILYHAVVIALAWGLTSLFASRPQIATKQRQFDPANVIYYSPSEYLPALDTGKSHAAKPLKGEPLYAKQPILSVPPESDNNHQTIVTPPDIKLTHDVATPNIVAWGKNSVPVPMAATERKASPLPALPSQIVAPVPDVNQAANRNVASLSQSIVAPPPDVDPGKVRAVASLAIDVIAPAPDATVTGSRRLNGSVQSAIVEPPPAVNAASVRRLGDINVGRSDVIAPAPQLPVAAQRTLGGLGGGSKAIVPPPPSLDASAGATSSAGSGRTARGAGSLGASSAQVVPPPPSIQGSRSTEGSGRIIALSLKPSVAPPSTPPQGNRRGTFAAGPEGKVDAPGTPDVRGSGSASDRGTGMSGNGNGAGSGSLNGAPPGLQVGAPPHAATSPVAGDPRGGSPSAVGNAVGRNAEATDSPRMMASASPAPKTHGPRVDLVDNPTPLELQVFGHRPLYSMTLNMPNLNSAGGSWVIRFAELKDNEGQSGQLSAPIAEHKVDPAYPIQLMQENVKGTVTLRAIIHADGSVGEIKVIQDPDVRLGRFAADALSKWHFIPATKNGSNVDVEAIVVIPFKPIFRKPF